MDSTSPTERSRPPIRVSQIISACSFCKARKIKCDGVAPACGGCNKFGRAATCSLSAAGSRQAKDYPTYLCKRIQRLQSLLEKAADDPTVLDSRSLGDHDFREGVQWSVDPNPDETPSSVDTLIADIGAVPIQASTYPTTGDGPTLSNILLGAASKAGLSLLDEPEAGQESHSCAAALPPHDVACRLAQLYIEQVYPRLPFFSIQGFWVQFNLVFSPEYTDTAPSFTSTVEGSAEERMGARTPRVDQNYSKFTVLLVLAIAASCLSRSADSAISSQAQRLFLAALEYRESAVKPNTIIGVQSLLFLIQYATLNPSVLDAWYLTGVGMRTCIDLGLHQDPEPLGSVSPSLLETRRRLWWSMYSFDRSISLGYGRPTELSDDAIGARLPSFRIESSATEGQIQGYLQRYRALRIQSEIYETLSNAPQSCIRSTEHIIGDLSGKLDLWASGNSPIDSQELELVESERMMGKILLYRPCRLFQQRAQVELEQLWQAGLRFTSIYRKLAESNRLFYVQIASEKMYWVGLTILHSFWGLSRGDYHADSVSRLDLWKAVQDVLYTIRTLSERWEAGRLLADKFEALSTSLIGMVEKGTRTNDGGEDLPLEIAQVATYVSLTGMWTAKEAGLSAIKDAELGSLICNMQAR